MKRRSLFAILLAPFIGCVKNDRRRTVQRRGALLVRGQDYGWVRVWGYWKAIESLSREHPGYVWWLFIARSGQEDEFGSCWLIEKRSLLGLPEEMEVGKQIELMKDLCFDVYGCEGLKDRGFYTSMLKKDGSWKRWCEERDQLFPFRSDKSSDRMARKLGSVWVVWPWA